MFAGEIVGNALASCLAQRMSELGIVENALDRSSDLIHIRPGYQEATFSLFDDFCEGTLREGNRRKFVSHGSEKGIVEGLEERGEKKNVQRGVNRFNLFDEAGENDCV